MRALRHLLAVGLLAGAAAAQANLVSNGSFEAPNKVGGSYWLYNTGAADITGWTVVGGAGESIQLTPDTYMGLRASEGRQWIDLTGIYGYDKGLRSDSFATVVGQRYAVSFDVGNYLPFGRSTLGLLISGQPERQFTNTSLETTAVYPMNWMHFSTEFVASSAMTTLTFLGRAAGSLSNNGGIGLDNVGVSAIAAPVPEPDSAWLLLAGLAMTGWIGRRSSLRGMGMKRPGSARDGVRVRRRNV